MGGGENGGAGERAWDWGEQTREPEAGEERSWGKKFEGKRKKENGVRASWGPRVTPFLTCHALHVTFW